jgi:hypothetical protein
MAPPNFDKFNLIEKGWALRSFSVTVIPYIGIKDRKYVYIKENAGISIRL